MFNVFKKNLKGTIENQCSEEKVILTQEVVKDQIVEEEKNFSAKDALEMTSLKWKNISTEEIFKEIKSEVSRGERRAYFWNSYLTGEQKLYFEELGYEVKIDQSFSKTPYFKVSW